MKLSRLIRIPSVGESVGPLPVVAILAEPIQLEISCRQVWKEISNYCDGEVNEELRQRIAMHLDNCKHCRAVYDGLRNTVTLVADDHALELPSELSTRLHAKLREYLARKS